MRYDLIDLSKKSQGHESESIVAIYHHCGFEKDLPTNYSEGVVLLQGTQDPVLEATIMSSLLCLLHAVRSRDVGVKRSRTKSILSKIVR